MINSDTNTILAEREAWEKVKTGTKLTCFAIWVQVFYTVIIWALKVYLLAEWGVFHRKVALN